ncbi:MAG: hypothetical protein IPK80_28600 [Nannocystis sp.]|nr:hypothetical protein [Nannocystis sp.]
MLERDSAKWYRKFLGWLMDKVEEMIAQMSEDKKPPKWWVALRKALEKPIVWLGDVIARPEILHTRAIG